MFSFTRLLVAAALATAAFAGEEPTTTVTVTATPTATSVSQCNVSGGAQCCQTTTTAGSSAGAAALALVALVVEDLEEVIGIECSPLTIGQSCSYSPVCCEENGIGDLISIGCINVIL
ncbi:fungal hydrophobin [Daedalea quercina L-15889]|uniref:Hydrophobin n=1 Tax=Daedalea quercina L-15889 TaxID=1314783 RepID=A0A165RCU6_9APHY|nr:fungal hydrophobin [Daedalea quercina L-15889]